MSLTVPNFGRKWDELTPKLNSKLLEKLKNKGYEYMTPVQEGTIPLMLGNKDVVVEAVTGSGKTLAYVLPIIQRFKPEEYKKKNQIYSLILSPTRELAEQIFNVFNEMIEDLDINLKPVLLTGGKVNLNVDKSTIRGGDYNVMIGTPGRIEDILKSSIVNVKDLEILVLDEADRLLEMGFYTSVNNIINTLPKQRRTGLFSATMTDDLTELVRVGLRNPVKVVVKVHVKSQKLTNQQRIPDSLNIQYIICDYKYKLKSMIQYILNNKMTKFIIYFSTCASVDFFFKVLKEIKDLNSYEIVSLHGKMDVKRRNATFKRYLDLSDIKPSILLTTDVASRGLDIPYVDCVVQYDLPTDPKQFSHRCGRTARAGNVGNAVYFLKQGNEELYPEFLNVRKIPSVKIEVDINEEEVLKLNNKIREIIAKDRDLVEKGIKAYVGFVQAYSKHQASYIFRIKEMDFADLAWAYWLLRMPKMPELKNKKIEFESMDVKFDDIPYSHKAKEEKRLNQKDIPKVTKEKRKKSVAWSETTQKKEKKTKKKIIKLNNLKEQYLKKE